MSGIQMTPIRWPDRWDPAFMDRLIREVFAKADVRNANAGTGITITGTPDEVATISASQDIEDLLAGGPLTALHSGVDTARQVVAGDGSIIITDNGGGGTLEIAVGTIQLTQLGALPDLSVIGVPTADDGYDLPTSINALANDTLLRRVSDTLDWGKLTADMFPDDMVTVLSGTEFEIETALVDLHADLDVDGDVEIQAGTLTILDSTLADSITVSHDGTNALAVFVGTTGFNLSGAAELELLGGMDVWIRDAGFLRIYDSADTDFGQFSHNGTNFITTFTNTTAWDISGAAEIELTGGMDLWIRDAGFLRVYDSGDTDYIQISHDGTDVNIAATNTTEVNATGAPWLFTSTIGVSANPALAYLNNTADMSSDRAFLSYQSGGAQFAAVGIGDIITGQDRDDFGIRVVSGEFFVSLDDGTTANLRMSTSLLASRPKDLTINSAAASATFATANRASIKLNASAAAVGGVVVFSDQDTDQSYIFGNTGELRLATLLSLPMNFYTNNTMRVQIDASGVVSFPSVSTTASAANAFLDSGSSPANSLLRSTSSIRYKQDIRDLTDAEAERVLELHPITFRSKAEADDQRRRHFGFTAEQVHSVEPKLVHLDGRGRPDGVQYDRIIAPLLQIVKRQERRIAALERKAA